MDNLNSATGESAAEKEVFTTADSTPETAEDGNTAAETPETDPEDVDLTDGDAESSEIDGDEGAEAADADTNAESVTEPDPFADLDEAAQYFSDEEIKNFRLPKASRAKFTEIQQRARDLNQKFEKLGGELAVEALAPLGVLLSKPKATPEELDAVIDSLADANPLVGAQFLQGAVMSVFDAPEFADEFLKHRFRSEKANLRNFETVVRMMDEFQADPAKIGELLKLDKAGVLDTEYARTQFAESFGESDLYNEMTSEMQELRAEVQRLREGGIQQNEQFGNGETVKRAVGDFDAEFTKTVSDAIASITGRVHWGKGALTDLLEGIVTQELRNSQSYRDVVEIIRQTGRYRDGDLLTKTQLQLLKNAAQARAVEKVRKLQKDIQTITTNAVRPAKQVKTGQTTEMVASEPKPAKDMPKTTLNPAQQLAQIRNRYKQALAAQNAANVKSQI